MSLTYFYNMLGAVVVNSGRDLQLLFVTVGNFPPMHLSAFF